MTAQNYLSIKKNEKLSISTSPALKEWISRYINVMHEKNPDDKIYSSVSSFTHGILENVMKIFEGGKTLEDFERFVDSEVEDFYDQITFKAPIFLYEETIERNKFQTVKKDTLRTMLGFRNFILNNVDFKNLDQKKIIALLQRFGNFIVKNKITNRFEVYAEGKTIIIEYVGNYKNIHFEYSKMMAGLYGIIGFRVKNIDYMENYTRYRIVEDYLFRSDGNIKERKRLAVENISLFLNFDRMLNANAYHLWNNLLQSKDNLVTFLDYNTGMDYVKSKISELKQNVPISELNKYILKMFESFHWITIDNLETFKFIIRISKEEHETLYRIIEDTFSTVMKFENEIHYLSH